MLNLIRAFIFSFIPIFVAVDAIGNIPLFLTLVEGKTKKEKKKIVLDSVVTAAALALLFMVIGKWILRILGITISDFKIAGGVLLFILAVRLLLPVNPKASFLENRNKDVGVFPLGTPLITGPAVLTTTLMLMDSFGFALTFVSLMVNMLVTWFILLHSDLILRLIGESGTRAFSKIMYILLGAIGVMMARKGIEEWLWGE